MNSSRIATMVGSGVSVGALFFLIAGPSAAQKPGQTGVFAWSQGSAANALELSLRVDRAGRRSGVPVFTLELRNVGRTDMVLNLGTMASDGTSQSPSAITLVLVDPQGKCQRLALKTPQQGSVTKLLLLPLPAGAVFSLPVDLNDYWIVGSSGFASGLEPGAYSLKAEFTGVGSDNPFATFRVIHIWRPGSGVPAAPFDSVNGQVDEAPVSNVLQFEIKRR